MARLGALASGIAGHAMMRATGDLRRGVRPEARDLLINRRNLLRIAEELARMRGAAMKVGQLISMDAGEVLPPELAEILARLRADAHFMPPRQLKTVLNANWGTSWLGQFRTFDVHPVAAASIGQVHRTVLKDGRVVAIKVQYPGVARSIDSDVSNVGALVRVSGLLPGDFDLAPWLDEARRQLHEETDYIREARCLERFRARLAADDRFAVPASHADWSTGQILTMAFHSGQPIETLETAPQDIRDMVATRLVDLFLQEIFVFGEMQSDPNFANYLFDPDTGRVVLLDFGATRAIDPAVVESYRRILRAGLAGDATLLAAEVTGLGVLDQTVRPEHQTRILGMIRTVFETLRAAPVHDFGDTTLSRQLQEQGMGLAREGYVPPSVPMDVLYLQRKVGGLFLLASRLKARVPVRAMLEEHLTV